MTTSADATFFAHSSMAKLEIRHLYACLFDHIRQGQNRIRQIVSCRSAQREGQLPMSIRIGGRKTDRASPMKNVHGKHRSCLTQVNSIPGPKVTGLNH